MQQSRIAGEDVPSDKQRKKEARATAAKRKAGQACAAKLRGAVGALNVYLSACRECADGSGDEKRGIADGRTILMRELNEYAAYLESLYNKPSLI